MSKRYSDGIKLGIVIGMSMGVICGRGIVLLQGYELSPDPHSYDIPSNEFASKDTVQKQHCTVSASGVRASGIRYHDPE